ncbi:unnamed protein product, partial [Ectocarpus fasciculatus]
NGNPAAYQGQRVTPRHPSRWKIKIAVDRGYLLSEVNTLLLLWARCLPNNCEATTTAEVTFFWNGCWLISRCCSDALRCPRGA